MLLFKSLHRHADDIECLFLLCLLKLSLQCSSIQVLLILSEFAWVVFASAAAYISCPDKWQF